MHVLTRRSRYLAAVAVILVVLGHQSARAANGMWTGAADSLWTNTANWSAAPFAGFATGESATFNSAGNGNTTLDVANLYSIWGITFDTANVAAYTIGSGAVNSQTLVMGGNGIYYLTGTAGNSQLVNASLQLGGSTQAGSYFFRNESTFRTLTFAGNVGSGTGSTAGTKTMSVYGAGSLVFSGNLYKGAATGIVLTNGLQGTLTLSGSNTIQTLCLAGGSTVTDVGSGFLGLSNAGGTALYATEDAVVNGTGKIWLSTVSTVATPLTTTDYANCIVASGKTVVVNPEITGLGGFEMSSGSGTFVLNGANTFEAHVALNAAGTLSVANIGNKGSLTSNLGQGGVIRFVANNARLLYTGTGETTDRSLRLEHNATLDHSGSGTLTFSSDLDVRGTAKTLTLQGNTGGIGEIAGGISNGTATTSLAKLGSGTWLLSGSNTYAGATLISEGTLTLQGANGAIAASSGLTVSNGASLRLENTASANNADRVRNAAAVTLAGGTLAFSHTAGEANYVESLGAVTVAGVGSTIDVAQADSGRTSALTLASLSRSGTGTLNFTGTGLGESDQCRVFITGQPDGIIGFWASVNGSAVAAYSSTRGVYAGSETEIPARGPVSEIPDDAGAVVRITSEGVSGPISLAGAPVSHVGILQQETGTPSVVDTSSKTLNAGSVSISAGRAALTVGVSESDGALAPLGAGSALTLNNDSSSTLTVNAALADNAASSLVKNGTGTVVIAGSTVYTGPTALNNGTLTFAGHAFTQTVAGVISGSGTLAKSGTNLLHLLASNTFTGPTLINAGIVRANQNSTFGTSTGGVFIADGATLDVGCTPDVGGTRAANTIDLQAEAITVQGTGANGKGALVNSSTGSQYFAIGKVTLSGDTTFRSRSRWDIRDGWLVMNDHAVTKLGTDTFSLSSVAVAPGDTGAAAFDIQEGSFRLQRTTQLNGGATNTVHLRSGTSLDLYEVVPLQAWSLTLEDGAVYNIVSSANSAQNFWGGPVTLNGSASLTSGGSYYGGFAGNVSGVGSLLKTNDHSFTLSGTNNTYSGTTRICSGNLYVASLRNLGMPSSLGQPTTIESGTIKIGGAGTTARLYYIGEGDTTDRVIDMAGTNSPAILNHSGTGRLVFNNIIATGLGSRTLYLQGSTSGGGEIACMITNGLTSGNVGVSKQGTGSWTLSGNNRYSGATTVDAGSLAFTGSNILLGSTTLNAGSLAYSGSNTLSGNTAVYAGSLAYSGTNILSGSLTVYSGFVTVSGTNGYGSAGIVVGTTNKNGTLTLTAGASLSGSGDFRFGNPGGSGALYINGASVLRSQTAGDQNFVFGRDLAYGYLNMTSGSVTAGRFQMAGVNVPISTGRGIARISGGTLSFSDYLLFARNSGCEAVLTMDGGTLNHINAGNNFCLAFAGGRAEVNMTGGTLNNAGKSLTILQNNGTGATGIVNLCSGTLTTASFINYFSGVAYLNFCGGTLKPSTGSAAFIPATMTGVYTYGPFGAFAGGGVIDTAGTNVTVTAPLQAPPGQGVTSVALANPGSGYIGEPYVSIEGGNGVGATAVANMTDDGTGSNTYKVASVTITCPGVNYTAAPTVLFKGGGYNALAAEAGAVTLANNTSGGLTKAGLGTLTLSGTNTYGGITAVSGGTLKLANAKALPTQTRLTLAGGTLDLGGFTVTNTVGGTGALTNGTLQATLSPAGEGAVGADTLALTLKSATLKGTCYFADVTRDGTCDSVAVQGDINLSNFALQIVDTDQLDIRQTYTLLTCTGTRTGHFSSTNLPGSRWHVLYYADGSVKLFYTRGTLLKVL